MLTRQIAYKRPVHKIRFMTESYRGHILAVHFSTVFGGWVAFVDGQIVRSKAGVSVSQQSITAQQAGRRWIRKNPK